MSSFAERCGVHDAARAAACERLLQSVREQRIDRIRIAWCDTHGQLRCKTLTAAALAGALAEGVGLVGTLLLKDSADRTAFPVWEAQAAQDLPGFAFAGNLVLLPDPASFQVLPWAEGLGWLRAEPWFPDARPVPLDTRRVLQQALDRLAARGFGLRCGLEVEFHVYRLAGAGGQAGPAGAGLAHELPLDPSLDPQQAGWPGPAPAVTLLHPGYRLLSEADADRCDEVFRILQRTCEQLKLPLTSLEIEFGPSQFEAVFDVADALLAADRMVLFRSAAAQALRRAGYLASFVCRPPFPQVMASGWHLHQSLFDLGTGANVMGREAPAPGSGPADAGQLLSDAGQAWLAGLLAHGRGMAVFCTPTIDGYGRFRPNALAPQSVLWGRDNRGAMLRVVGEPGAGAAATRIENRIGEPCANPYLYIASQVHAGLDGLAAEMRPPPGTDAPYAGAATPLPASLGEALDALAEDRSLCAAFGQPIVDWLVRIKRQEIARFEAAEDRAEWLRREYFGRC